MNILKTATGARNHTQCDSLLLGSQCGAHTFPYIEVMNPTAQVEHEATTSTIGEDQLFYCRQRGIPVEDAASMIVNGFCREVSGSCRWNSPSRRRSSSASVWKGVPDNAGKRRSTLASSSLVSASATVARYDVRMTSK